MWLPKCYHNYRNKWIRSWLSGRSQRIPVVLDDEAKGSVLGPVCFLIFADDLSDNIRSSVRLITDDCVLYRNIFSPSDCES